ncbi:hypothetical protein D3C85_1153800 [compost metagenome]
MFLRNDRLQQASITATVKHQRRAVKAIKGQHFPDQNDVITTFVLVSRAALETRRTAFEQRDAVSTASGRQPGEFVGATLGKQVGQILLIVGQDVHGKVLGTGKRVGR